MYLSMLIITAPVLAANARGEGGGNGQTLQKVSTPQGTYTLLSGQSIRRAIREGMQDLGATLWRRSRAIPESVTGYGYGPNNDSISMVAVIPKAPEQYDDTILFGYMIAQKTTADGESTAKCKAALDVTTALSLTPYVGDAFFGQGLNYDKAKGDILLPYHMEQHYTRYAIGMTVNLSDLRKRPGAFKLLIDVLSRGLRVGGNHSAHLANYDADTVLWSFHQTPGAEGLLTALRPGDIEDIQNLDLKPAFDRLKGKSFSVAGTGDPEGRTVTQGFSIILQDGEMLVTQ